MGSIVLKSLSVLLGIFFVFVGTMKLTSHISKDLHKDLRKEYVKYAKVFPLSGTLDFKVPSKWYRRVVGSLEIICGLAMAIIPSRRCKRPTTFFDHKVKNLSNTVLLLLMLMAVYSHYMVNDKFERIAPALVFFFMLTGRLVIDWQLRREDAQSVTANGVDDKAKKQD
ncbi:putative acetylcholine receptor chaperone isoform X1 [Temnothorax americanus]|uniref:novel acetylcholine receptor chaperone isoform X1 n=1 Tax=Temnothorax nylanderi TaxID=102681 RepID=UPI003A87B91F